MESWLLKNLLKKSHIIGNVKLEGNLIFIGSGRPVKKLFTDGK